MTGAAGNDDDGVWCEIQGHPADLDDFEARVVSDAPPLARIDAVISHEVPTVDGEQTFTVALSTGGDPEATVSVSAVPPDVAPCAACLDEVADAADRRHRYAFACCTDCGPRYTVIKELPYDRELTSMAPFELCRACAAEYGDPGDRRHHAQAVCCPACGPALSLRSTSAAPVDEADESHATVSGVTQSAERATEDPIEEAALRLRAGQIIAIKGLGGYQLACRADNSPAVARMRRRKHRDQKPFALLVASVDAARELVDLDDRAVRALTGPEAPIVLAPRRGSAEVTSEVAPHTSPTTRDPARGVVSIAPEVAPDTRLLGVMLPATPLHAMLAESTGVPLVCTSGNRSDEPIVISDDRVGPELGGIADAVLTHDRVIERRADDSVGHVVGGGFQLLRRARGYAPRPVQLRSDGPDVLAVGAALKNTVCLAVGAKAIVSVHLGDLEHPAALASFEAAVADLLALSRSTPQLVVHDLHPEYLSTKFARSADLAPLLGVQHHHAHLASCLADVGWAGPAIGVMFDGMGWGTDGTLWGGEILVGDAGGYDRLTHLAPVPMPGGTAAVREPWRMAVSHLHAAFEGDLEHLPVLPGFESRLAEAQPVVEQCTSSRSITTTSMGRLFDAVAALCGVGDQVAYEGQAAIRLEQLAGPSARRYPVTLSDGSPAEIETATLMAAVVNDLRGGIDLAEVAGAFHRWAAEVVLTASRLARERSGVSAVALSGGVFQNRLLVESAVPLLTSDGFEVLLHGQVPPNDGGISLGQVAVGRATLASRD